MLPLVTFVGKSEGRAGDILHAMQVRDESMGCDGLGARARRTGPLST